jgi:rifampicin phosphotransferase
VKIGRAQADELKHNLAIRNRVGHEHIAAQTDSAWTPLFLAAAGVIVEAGATMSHAAIVARELGIPAEVGIANATSTIANGVFVTINGDTGEVMVEESLPDTCGEE